jgi:peptidyl-tRNA hydrolase, PTH1 family
LEDLFIIVGLGNPGSRYDNTRHNVGFDTIDLLSHQNNIKVSKIKYKAVIGEGTLGRTRVILVKPQTFMNLSGESVRELMAWYKVPPANLIIIYDDIDLPLGKLRVRPSGSSGTHNGMRSVIYQTQSDQFPRIRIGIGRPPENWDLADFVLSKFTADDRKVINEVITKAADAVISIVSSGVNDAMSKFNK